MDVKPRLDALTGLRLLAAAAVAFAHLPHLHVDPALAPTVRRAMAEGFAGVPFFFVLSGFVLTYGYHDRLARPTRAALAGYYAARVARIWPVHLLALGLAALLPVAPVPGRPGPALANALLVHAWVPDLGYIQSYNSVSWTLSIEAFFYLLLPGLLWAAARWRSAGPVTLTLAAAAAWLLPAGLVLWHAGHLGPWSLYLCNVCPAVRLGEFAVGGLLGLALVRAGGPGKEPPTRRGWLFWTVLELAAVLAVAVMVKRSDRVHLLFRLSGYYTPAFALVVAVFARQRGALSGLMAGRLPVYLGEVSFAYFLLHAIVFVHVGRWVGEWGGSFGRAAVPLAAAGVAAVAVHHLVEVPMRARLVRLAKPRRSVGSIPLVVLARITRFRRAGAVPSGRRAG